MRRTFSWLTDTKSGQVTMTGILIPICLIWWTVLVSVLVNTAFLAVNLLLLYITQHRKRSGER